MDASAPIPVNPLAQDIEAQVSAQLVNKKEVKFAFRTTEIPDESKAGQTDPKQISLMLRNGSAQL